jgi:GTP-binding protein
MIPAEEVDIQQKYEILLNELKKYNPSLLEKSKILAISKSDMLDDELKEAMKKNLPTDVPAVFISSLTGEGIPELKDLIWS